MLDWSKFLQKVDPDMVIGYNISGFDFPYLMDRAKHLKLVDFPYLGRLNSTAPSDPSLSFTNIC